MGRSKTLLTTVACSALSVFVAGVVRELQVIKKMTEDADVDNRDPAQKQNTQKKN